MQESDLAFATIAEAGALLRAGETTSMALTELMLARIAALDGRLNAFITVTDDLALQQAEAADAALQAGHDAGPLHGIPVAVKDLIDTAGVRTTNGSKLFADRVPDEDATVVVRLQEAGAVLLGKTNLHELAWGTTSINPYFGPVANPWAPDHHPGGSSGGSAAAVAAGMAYAALGTDTGCSVRQPAHCCGITGLKPSFGRVSKAGVFALVWSHDHVGPLTRSVADAGVLLDALAGPDPDDPYSLDAPDDDADPIEAPIAGMRIGVPRPYFFEGGDAEVVATVEQALASFEELGATLVDLELPNTDAAFGGILACFAEAVALHAEDWHARPDDFSDEIIAKLERSAKFSGADVAAAYHFRQQFRRDVERVMGDCTVLATPTATVAAAPIAEQPPAHAILNWRNCSIFNFTGQPSISVPCGFTAAGLPVGLMLTGRMFADRAVLRVAHAFEQATDWHRKRPPL